MSELNNEFGLEPQKSAACFSLWLFHWTPSSNASTTRTISPETAPQHRISQENVSPPTPKTHGKSNDSFKPEDNSMEGVSFLTNAYTQFANKPIQDCIKDGFPLPFLRCQISRAPESSKICANCGIR